MPNKALPLVISAPEPRTLELIFTPPQLARLKAHYRIVETTADGVAKLPADVLAEARYIIGQPPISPETLEAMKALRCVFNVETNLLNNMPYETLFARGIHVVTTGLVFAEPVAELGLAMALNLARNIVDADLAFRKGEELWGGDGNLTARLRQVEPRVQELQNLLREAELAMETFDEVFVRELLQLAHPDKHNDSPLARRVTQRLLAMRGAR